MKISAILKRSICLLGLVSAGNFFTAPANAEQAAARAAVSITNPGSFTQSVSGEVLLPDGLYFSGTAGKTLIVTPSITVGASGSSAIINSLSFSAGEIKSVRNLDPANDISDAVASILEGTNLGVKAVTIDDAAAIIKSAAGINGLE